MKILVIEKNGTQLGKVSNFSDPEVEDYCWHEGVTYRIDCQICLKDGVQAVYHGAFYADYQSTQKNL